MAKPNYRFDKKQREAKKERKQEEKRLKKLARKAENEPAAAAPGETAVSEKAQ